MKKRKPKAAKPMDMPSSEREHRSVSVRKIKNGFLAEHSSSGPDTEYKSETTYHAKKPKITFDVQGDAPTKTSKSPRAKQMRAKRLEGKEL